MAIGQGMMPDGKEAPIVRGPKPFTVFYRYVEAV